MLNRQSIQTTFYIQTIKILLVGQPKSSNVKITKFKSNADMKKIVFNQKQNRTQEKQGHRQKYTTLKV